MLLLIKRAFLMPDGTELPDPNPALPPSKVREYYESTYPQLTNALVQDHKDLPQEDGSIRREYAFTLKVGTKG